MTSGMQMRLYFYPHENNGVADGDYCRPHEKYADE